MRLNGILLVALILLAGGIRAEDASARKIIEAAIRAQGGSVGLSKHPVITIKTTGIFQGYKDKPVFFHTSEITSFGAHQYRNELRCDLSGTKLHVVNVLDNDRGWVSQSVVPKAGKTIQKTDACTPEQLARFQQAGNINLLTTSLVHALGPEYTLQREVADNVASPDLIGVRVSRKGQPDVSLYFDRQTSLLKKLVHKGTAGTDEEGTVETRLGRYEEFEGLLLPSSWETWFNNQCLWSHHVEERKFTEKPAPNLFTKP